MRENSYHAILTEMTVRALWETQNVLDCIPDELWDRPYGGAPLWQHIYHMLHALDQWFINPRDRYFVEPPIHTPRLEDLARRARAEQAANPHPAGTGRAEDSDNQE